METINNSPLLILRENNKSFKARKKRFDKRIRSKNHLRTQIYSNHNVFHSNVDLYRTNAAQDIIWDKNYQLKCLINQTKEENNSIRARVWNIEKQNRRMEHQIQAWNLADCPHLNLPKPQINHDILNTVLSDQDYQIVSMKMQIYGLERELQQREETHTWLINRNRDLAKVTSVFNHEIAMKKVELFGSEERQEEGQREQLALKMVSCDQQIDSLSRDRQIKHKFKGSLSNEIGSIQAEIKTHKDIKGLQIGRMKEEIERMRGQEDGGLILARSSLRGVKMKTLQLECEIQQRMNQLIQIKIPLQQEIQSFLSSIHLSHQST